MDKVDEFKDFVRSHPGLKDEVKNGLASWQNLYEAWYLYGADDGQWATFKEKSETREEAPTVDAAKTEEVKSDLSGPEMIAQAFEYLQKVDIDKVQKTMGTFQQFIQIFQTMQGTKGGAGSAAAGLLAGSNSAKKNYSGFFSQFDD